MTLPYEQYHAMVNTRAFLVSMLNPKETPKIPKAIRELARHHLKHYPAEYEAYEMVQFHTERVDRPQNIDEYVEYSPTERGWVFWIEIQSRTSRPFLTREAAEKAYTMNQKEITKENENDNSK